MLQTHVNNDIYNKYCLIHNKKQQELKKIVFLCQMAGKHGAMAVYSYTLTTTKTHSERKKKKRQTEEEMGRQYQRVDRNGLYQLN